MSGQDGDGRLPARLIFQDGSERFERLSAGQQARLYARCVHLGQQGLVELAGARRQPDGGYRFAGRRTDPADYLAAGDGDGLAERAAHHRRKRLDVLVTPLPRTAVVAGRAAVADGGVIWVDVDDVEDDADMGWVDTLRPHLLIASGAGTHAYWCLDRAVSAERVESLNRRLAAHLRGDLRAWLAAGGSHVRYWAWATRKQGERDPGDPQVSPALGADYQACDAGRLMRLPGTFNARRGRWCRIVRMDLARARVNPDRLEQHLPDPKPAARARPAARRAAAAVQVDDATLLAPPEYFRLLAGIEVGPDGGMVVCPVHAESAPSCQVFAETDRGWRCFGCGQGGRIYDLASALDGGPTGRALAGEDFKRVKRRVHEQLGVAAPTPTEPERSAAGRNP